jgi:subtilisin
MTEESLLPAWSEQFAEQAIQQLTASGPIAELKPEWAWGGSRGKGVRVAVVDSGVEHDHPALGDCVCGGVVVEYDEEAENNVRIEPDEDPCDFAGHGTACAGIIHAIAPEAEIYSVRVLGKDMHGRAIQFAAGLDWATEHGMQVVNLSLSTSTTWPTRPISRTSTWSRR